MTAIDIPISEFKDNIDDPYINVSSLIPTPPIEIGNTDKIQETRNKIT